MLQSILDILYSGLLSYGANFVLRLFIRKYEKYEYIKKIEDCTMYYIHIQERTKTNNSNKFTPTKIWCLLPQSRYHAQGLISL